MVNARFLFFEIINKVPKVYQRNFIQKSWGKNSVNTHAVYWVIFAPGNFHPSTLASSFAPS